MPVVVNEIVQTDFEVEIQARIDAERARLRAQAGLARMREFKKPVERTFTGPERDYVTILFGGLTWKHEEMIKAVFHGSGYRCENIPTPVVADFQAGKEFGNNGQCNPTYFTVGNLVRYLQKLEQQGETRQQIIDNYVFFTAGSCGPCRFGMYEAEYRFALQNAGFEGFRVLLFQQTDGIKAASGEPGLKFSVDFGMGMLNALNLGDVINELVYQVRPFEVNKGETDRVIRDSVKTLTDTLRDRKRWHIMEAAPEWARPYIAKTQEDRRARLHPGEDRPQSLWQGICGCPARLPRQYQRDRSGSPAGEAGNQNHRRVLGADHRGRRQFQHVRVPGKGRRAGPGRTDRHLDRLHDVRGKRRRQGSCRCGGSVSGIPSGTR